MRRRHKVSNGTIDIEKTNLEAHVELCANRYESLDKRLSSIENTVKELHKSIQEGHHNMVKVIVGTAGTVLAGMLSVVVVLLMKM